MAFHEEMQVRRYTTCLVKERDPDRKKRFVRIIAKWKARAKATKLPAVPVLPPFPY